MTNSDGGFQFDFQKHDAAQPAVPPTVPENTEKTQAFDPLSFDQPTVATTPVSQTTQATQAMPPASEDGGTRVMPTIPISTEPAPTEAAATQVLQPISEPARPAAPAVMPPAIAPDNEFNTILQGDSDDQEDNKHHNAHHGGDKHIGAIIGAIIAVAVVAALATGGVMWWRSNSTKVAQTEALAQCKKAASKYDTAKKELTSAITQGQASAQTPSDQVADANTITTLNQALQDAATVADTASCDTSLSTDELKKQVSDMTDATTDAHNKTDAITAAIKAINSSKSTASENALKTNLTTAIEQAQSALNTSAGTVADESTRDALQSAISNANTVLGNATPSSADVNNAISALQKAIVDVNASITAKQQADAESAKKAEEAEEAENQQNQQNSSNADKEQSDSQADDQSNAQTNSQSSNDQTTNPSDTSTRTGNATN